MSLNQQKHDYDRDPFADQTLKRLQMLFYLAPIVGFFPALWHLYQRQGSQEQKTVCRLSVTLAFVWLSAYVLLATAASEVQISELLTLRLLFMNGLITSSYFLVSFWLMLRMWQGKAVRLPGISSLAESVTSKYLS